MYFQRLDLEECVKTKTIIYFNESKTVDEMKDYLKSFGFEENVINSCIQKMITDQYVNFCENISNSIYHRTICCNIERISDIIFTKLLVFSSVIYIDDGRSIKGIENYEYWVLKEK